MFHQLQVEFDYDFLLLGISCHERDYRLCWYLNKALGIGLEMQPGIDISVKKVKSNHPLYSFENEDEHIYFSLVANRSEGGLLCPEYPQVDYILKVEDEMLSDLGQHLKKVREIPIVIAAFEIPLEKLKSKHNLIFE